MLCMHLADVSSSASKSGNNETDSINANKKVSIMIPSNMHSLV